jgi:hypothetical protein
MRGLQLAFVLTLVFWEQPGFCCRCPEKILKNESVFCGQELQGSDCSINVQFVCFVGSAVAKKTSEDCNGLATGKNCAPISRKLCWSESDSNSTLSAYTELCLKERGCYSVTKARKLWQEYNSKDPKFRFQLPA